jgi:hypothetical protein
MGSAFPGMDPYLEGPAWWPDFHTRFVNALSESIADRLPEGYQAALNEQVVLIEPDLKDNRDIEPDVTVVRATDVLSNAASSRGTSVGVLEPQTIPNIVRLDPHVEVYIELRYGPDQDVVTVIELLSPSNKSGAGRGQYVQKRDALLRRRVNIVELDLLRGGTRLQLAKPLPKGDYHALVSRGDRWPDCQVYTWRIRDEFPALPIPLKTPDSDVHVPLAEAFAEAYRRGHYAQRIRYNDSPPPPAFATGDDEWVAETANQNWKNKDVKNG